VATFLGSIPAFSDNVESKGAADEAGLKKVHKKSTKKPLLRISFLCVTGTASLYPG
jgi:hypothetical protein